MQFGDYKSPHNRKQKLANKTQTYCMICYSTFFEGIFFLVGGILYFLLLV